MNLTSDQTTALAEILAACAPGGRHLLTGYAGSGKTTLMQEVTRALLMSGKEVVLTAPTHKAVSVLRSKVHGAGIDVACITIHSLLSLQPYAEGPKTKLRRRKGARHVEQSVVVIDECSMLDAELMGHIRRHLGHVFVLFVGDPAQLPPVGEKESESFATKSLSHLATIVRQAAENPVLKAAHVIRESQGGPMDMSWAKKDAAAPLGVYLPNGSTDTWMQKAFTSPEFKADNDAFRYLCWTNDRVAQVNRKVRRWIYGDTVEPFSVGESVLIRAPIFAPINPRAPMDDRKILFNTNEEAPVLEIRQGVIVQDFPRHGNVVAWKATIPAWRIALQHDDGSKVLVLIPQDQADFDAVNERLVAEAKHNSARWSERYEFAKDVARLQSVYALTVHNSQGSTFKNVFVDVEDIRRRAKTNTLECQQMLYVAATRPSHALMLVGM